MVTGPVAAGAAGAAACAAVVGLDSAGFDSAGLAGAAGFASAAFGTEVGAAACWPPQAATMTPAAATAVLLRNDRRFRRLRDDFITIVSLRTPRRTGPYHRRSPSSDHRRMLRLYAESSHCQVNAPPSVHSTAIQQACPLRFCRVRASRPAL